VVGMVAVVPGLGRSFRDAAADQESCGDHGESRARSDWICPHRIVVIRH
jgi:hypothetical protein